MRRFVIVMSAVVFAGLAAWPSVAAAQSVAEPRTWNVTPFVGVAFGTNAPTGSGGIGAAVEYDWTSNLGIEGEVSRLFDMSGDDENVDWSVTSFTANAIYHFDVLHVTPYAEAGLGFARSSLHVDDPAVTTVQASSTEVTFNFGGGVKYPISSKLLARADLRRFQSNDLAPDYWRLYGGITFVMK